MVAADGHPVVTGGSFRGKPSKSHIIWVRETRDGVTNKRFDSDHFRKWAAHCGFDFETTTRVDHDRADEPREQFRVVFKWGTVQQEEIEFGDESWEFGKQKTPRTFIEVDEEGVARVKGWRFERLLDITMMRHKGPELLIETASGERKRLNGRKFLTHPRERQREGTE